MTAELPGQFLLAPDRAIREPGWRQRSVGAWQLSHHGSLPVARVEDTQGSALGLFLGWPVTAGGARVGQTCRVPANAGRSREALEDFLYLHGGRWVFVEGASDPARVYLDALGSLALVYEREGPAIASTLGLLGAASGFGRGPGDAGDSSFPRPNQFFPPEWTADPDLARLLPNHCLGVASRAAQRHWPREPLLRGREAEIDACVDRIAASLRATLGAFASEGPIQLSLTAGRDSRVLLASSREHLDAVQCFTFDDPRETGPVDVEVARCLAGRHGLRHQVVPVAPAEPALEREYLARIGHAGHPGKSRDLLGAVRAHLPLDRPWLAGFGGEVGRAFYWRNRDAAGLPLSAAELAQRLGLPASEPFRAALGRWLHGLPDGDRLSQLDFAYLELRMGMWAGPHLYGAAFHCVATPFSHRQIVTSMLRLPADYRRREGLARDLIRSGWPELLDHPFQRVEGIGGLARWLRDRQLAPRARKWRERIFPRRVSETH